MTQRKRLSCLFLHLFFCFMCLSLFLVNGVRIEAATRVITIRVRDTDGNPVGNVLVSINRSRDNQTFTERTNAEGFFSFYMGTPSGSETYIVKLVEVPTGAQLIDGNPTEYTFTMAVDSTTRDVTFVVQNVGMSSGDKGFFGGLIQSILDGFTNLIVNPLKNALEALGNFIIEGIKGLFVPKQETLTTFKESVMDKLNTKLGFIGQSIDYAVVKPIEMLTGITGAQTSLNLPSISLFGRTIIDIDYDLTMITQPPFKTFYDIYYTVVSFGLVTGFIAYIYSKYKGVISS